MAVVQISRIQVRRGRRNSSTGIPQLASGELGWAVDTQELYVGNGAVSEGAPSVGNTKVLTEKDNILDLALAYQYKKDNATIQTGSSPATPISRSLQDRLDETINIRSFGAVGDGVVDDTEAIQRALNGLYLNDATVGSVSSRVPLIFDAGEYLITQTLMIPPHAELRGAGKDKTVFASSIELPLALTVGDNDPGLDLSYLTQCRNLFVSGITFKKTNDTSLVFSMSSIRDSKFVDCAFRGNWQRGPAVNFDSAGIAITAETSLVTSQNVLFENCDISDVSVAVDSTFDIQHIRFENCLFTELGYGAFLGDSIGVTGRQFGPRHVKINSSKFIDIDKSAIYVGNGHSIVSSNNVFFRCAQDGGSSDVNNKLPIIDYRSPGNISDNDFFERAFDLGSTANLDYIEAQYVSEVEGATLFNHKFNNRKNVAGALDSMLFRLPASIDISYLVHYVYKSTQSEIYRKGTMTVLADTTNNRVRFTDEFDTAGNFALAENLTFSASYNQLKKSININYTTNQTGTFTYWYEAMA